jgi:hypothetical protein
MIFYNPDAQSGLKPNSVLLIGKQSVATTPVASASKRMQLLARILLLPKKLIRNRKTYNISDEDLKKQIRFLKRRLAIGQILLIPSKKNVRLQLVRL